MKQKLKILRKFEKLIFSNFQKSLRIVKIPKFSLNGLNWKKNRIKFYKNSKNSFSNFPKFLCIVKIRKLAVKSWENKNKKTENFQKSLRIVKIQKLRLKSWKEKTKRQNFQKIHFFTVRNKYFSIFGFSRRFSVSLEHKMTFAVCPCSRYTRIICESILPRGFWRLSRRFCIARGAGTAVRQSYSSSSRWPRRRQSANPPVTPGLDIRTAHSHRVSKTSLNPSLARVLVVSFSRAVPKSGSLETSRSTIQVYRKGNTRGGRKEQKKYSPFFRTP